jgi:hypothetical protein
MADYASLIRPTLASGDSQVNIYDKIDSHWRAGHERIEIDAPPWGTFLEFLTKLETETQSKTVEGLQPALGIFELSLEWLSYAHVTLSSKKGHFSCSEDARVPWALIGAAVSFGLGIRRLSLSGLDTPARALLRTYVETLLLCIVALHDSSVCEAFIKAEADSDVKNFWHKIASPKNLHERVIQIEREKGIEESAIAEWKSWRRQEYEVLSQSSHLSYVAAFLTTLCPKLDDEETFVPGLFGQPNANSLRTVSYAAATTWYFSRMSMSKILGKDKDKCLIVLDAENEWHQRLFISHEALSAVFLGSGPIKSVA